MPKWDDEHMKTNLVNYLLSISIKMDVCVYTYVCVCVCVYVCMSGHNSGTPGANSTKLGTHIAICMCKNLVYVLYVLRREDCVGGREFG
jgi:hypothetical protein